jgi:hypothetical protein
MSWVSLYIYSEPLFPPIWNTDRQQRVGMPNLTARAVEWYS